MRKHRSPRNRVSNDVPSHNTDDTEKPSSPDTFNPAEVHDNQAARRRVGARRRALKHTMPKDRSPRNRVSNDVPSHGTDDTEKPSSPGTFNSAEALQSLYLRIVDLEALSNAANEAVARLPFPSGREARRPFNRVYILVGKLADESAVAMQDGGQMMDALTAHLQRNAADQ